MHISRMNNIQLFNKQTNRSEPVCLVIPEQSHNQVLNKETLKTA